MSANRILVEAENLNEMVVFLKRVVGLTQRVQPPYKGSSVWLYKDHEPAIFVVQKAANECDEEQQQNTSLENLSTQCDLAFDGNDYYSFLQEMTRYGIQYSTLKAKAAGCRSVIVEGPSGIKIEMRLQTGGH